jgi:hypothetical protein
MTEPLLTLWLTIRMFARVCLMGVRLALLCWSTGMTVRAAEAEVRRHRRFRQLVEG